MLIPGITDKEEYLSQLNAFIKTLKNVERVEILPYHTLGTFKYDKLNIEYPLKGIEPPSKDSIEKATAILMQGLEL